jgi:hypothetical protein
MHHGIPIDSRTDKWHTTEREAFAVYKCIEVCNWMLHGSKFPITVITDHVAT